MGATAEIAALKSALRFDNRFVSDLPGDDEPRNYVRQVANACYSLVEPTAVAAPRLVAYAREVASLLGFDDQQCTSDAFARVFAGNELIPGMQPFAMRYGGHQFGNWAGQLGDGRAINLGETVNHQGERWMMQLKGAGPTPYSRTADGLAVLRSSVREFLCSEAMHHLGVPTTRALSLVLTGESVVRDMFYDGNPRAEPGAVVCRVAPSFTRFGNFQIFAAQGEEALLKQFVDHTITIDFAGLELPRGDDGALNKDCYIEWLAEVCRRTAVMIVHWQRVGFVHGVMNTDNMSILGLTIDYGPYGWLEDFDPGWTPNTTDAQGRRYRYGHQPQIALWNLVQLANAIYPLIGETEPLEQALNQYGEVFEREWQAMMSAKLGLSEYDASLIDTLLDLLPRVETDMTQFYRKLSELDGQRTEAMSDAALVEPLRAAFYVQDQLSDAYLHELAGWLKQYWALARNEPAQSRQAVMRAVNPKYVLRNYLAQLAIDKAEEGDFSMVSELLDTLRAPYAEQSEREIYAAKRPDWARQRAGCSMLSCSS
ncbi:MAG: YdiU family protein [Pseudomonadota bacterium]